MKLNHSTIALAIIFTSLLVPIKVSAQHMNATDSPCSARASNAEETFCFIKQSEISAQELDSFYTHVEVVLNAMEQAKLEAAQQTWKQFRDQNCEAERALYGGGSASSMVYAACLAADNKQRIAELHTIYDWVLEKRQEPNPGFQYRGPYLNGMLSEHDLQ